MKMHWVILDHAKDLTMLVRSEYFVPTTEIYKCVRQASTQFYPFASLASKSEFTTPEWYTWLAFGIPAIEITIHPAWSKNNPTCIWKWIEEDS